MTDVIKACLLQLGKWYNDHPVWTLVAIFVVLGLVVPSGLGVCRAMYLAHEQEKTSTRQIINSNGKQNQNMNTNDGTVTQNNGK